MKNNSMRDEIKTGDISGVGIAIGIGASVQIYGDVHYYPINLRAPLRRAFDPLIEDRRELFGGREAFFTRIAKFIQNPAGGYLVLTAPAGFGKTALMANLVDSTPQAFAYHFFTSLYGDSLTEDFFLRNAVEQMAQWHGHTEQLPDKMVEVRALYQKFLAEPLEHTQVLVLDGLDEVTNWKLAPYLSRRLLPNLHLILTVRDVGQDWASDYSLPVDQTTHLPLGGLTRDDVAQVLNAAGGGAIVFAEDPKLLDEVMRVSAYQADETLEADPFYVRLLAGDAAADKLTPENISKQPQGLNSYLDQWWQEVKQMVGDTPAKDLFGTLAVALGWLSRPDLEAINPSLVDAWAADFFYEVICKVRRFVVHDESQGYAIAHPRLRQYMTTKIKTDTYHEKLLAYCANWAQHKSPYALVHYAQHLQKAGQKQALYALIDKPWMNAKFNHTYSHRAFAADVNLAIEMAAADESHEGLIQLVRGCLIYATLGELATAVPPEVLGILAQGGEVAKALGYAALIQDKSKQSEAYREIGQLLLFQGKKEEGKQAISLALAAAKSIQNEVDKASALGDVAQAMGQAGDKEGLKLALAAAETIQDLEYKASTLSNVAQVMAQAGEREGAISALQQALVAAEMISYNMHKLSVLSNVAQAMVQAGDRAVAMEVVYRVLAEAEVIQDELYKSSVLSRVAQAMGQAGDKEGLNRTLVAAQGIKYEHKSSTLSAVVQAMVQARQKEVAHNALAVAEAILDLKDKSIALSAVAQAMGEAGDKEGLNRALAAARAIQDGWEKAYALSDVAQAMVQAGDKKGLNRTLAAAQAIKYEPYKSYTLSAVAQIMGQAGYKAVAIEVGHQALAAIQTIQSEWDKASVLRIVAQAMGEAGDKEGLNWALATVEDIQHERLKAYALSILARAMAQAGDPAVAVKVTYQALATAEEIQDEVDKAFALSDVAQAITQTADPAVAVDMAKRALAAAKAIHYEVSKASALSAMAQAMAQGGNPEIAVEVANRILAVAEAIQDEGGDKARALNAVAKALVQAGDPIVAREIAHRALAAAQAIQNGWSKSSALSDVAQAMAQAGDLALAMEVAQQALTAAEAIHDDYLESSALSDVAQAMAQAGNPSEAKKVVNRALDAAKAIKNVHDILSALRHVAQAMGQAGDKEGLNRALTVIEAIMYYEKDKALALSDVAKAMAQAGDPAAAMEVAHRALAIAEEIQYEGNKASALSVVAQAMAQSGDQSVAVDVAQRALEAVEAIQFEWPKASALSAVAEAMVQAGDPAAAMEVVYRVLAAVEAMQEEAAKSYALRGVAKAMLKGGLHTDVLEVKALDILRKAFQTICMSARKAVFSTLEKASSQLAAIDKGQTLRKIYQAIQEVDGWWGAK